ncbi:MAG: Gfo/Idh/MocA family oxidoreductase [Verrucomicrobia bacterium]|nr:Gfo/Idh/MocA family oxidoreductase [Verrucomicrobiota bacterium]
MRDLAYNVRQEGVPPFFLIGMGPFAKKHYVNLFKKHAIYPEFVVDLDCNRDKLSAFLEAKELPLPLYLVPEQDRDAEVLPESTKRDLLRLIKAHSITHAIVATEPKAHFAYLDFLIECGVDVLVEKPLTAPLGCSHSVEAAKKIEEQYTYLLQKAEKHKVRVDLQCQRRYHPIYQFLLQEIESFVAEFSIPLSYAEVYHCDGMWNMPDEFVYRENHPYKYGYGKLMHSGYHFIDLLALFLETSYKASPKTPDSAEIYATPYNPGDFLHLCNQEDYARLFQGRDYQSIFAQREELGFKTYGELDFFSLIQLFSEGKRLTTCSLNLLQTGFSRRAWTDLPEDTYKANGRIRHERINLQFGHLFNMQVHSYVSSESREKSALDPLEVGGLRHFDIYLFRNSQLVGGKPFAKLNSSDFTKNLDSSFNEQSREECFFRFLDDLPSLSSLKDHKLGITILSHSLQAIAQSNRGEPSIQRFQMEEPAYASSTSY